MKFDLSTASTFYTVEGAEKLKALEFQFDNQGYDKRLCKCILPSNVEIEINSLEELLAFANKWGALVVTEDSIMIYDVYCE